MATPKRQQNILGSREADKARDLKPAPLTDSDATARIVPVDVDTAQAALSVNPVPGPSPVQTIQDRLEQAFAAHHEDELESRKDLRLLGLAIAVIFSLMAWTLILQFVRIGL